MAGEKLREVTTTRVVEKSQGSGIGVLASTAEGRARLREYAQSGQHRGAAAIGADEGDGDRKPDGDVLCDRED